MKPHGDDDDNGSEVMEYGDENETTDSITDDQHAVDDLTGMKNCTI